MMLRKLKILRIAVFGILQMSLLCFVCGLVLFHTGTINRAVEVIGCIGLIGFPASIAVLIAIQTVIEIGKEMEIKK